MRLIFIATCFALANCNSTSVKQPSSETPTIVAYKNTTELISDTAVIGVLESSMIQAGLINVRWLDPEILVDLRYSSTNNFLGLDIYGDLSNAYLEETAAKKLAVAQFYLNNNHKGLRIKVWDAARPISTQQVMWDAVRVPSANKGKFVSNPKNHSLHNYGCAVDITLVDATNKELDMGTEFDQFDSLAQPKYETIMLKSNKLSADQVHNRKLLRTVMNQAGFTGITSEWWHFNSCTRRFAKLNYTVIR